MINGFVVLTAADIEQLAREYGVYVLLRVPSSLRRKGRLTVGAGTAIEELRGGLRDRKCWSGETGVS